MVVAGKRSRLYIHEVSSFQRRLSSRGLLLGEELQSLDLLYYMTSRTQTATDERTICAREGEKYGAITGSRVRQGGVAL